MTDKEYDLCQLVWEFMYICTDLMSHGNIPDSLWGLQDAEILEVINGSN